MPEYKGKGGTKKSKIYLGFLGLVGLAIFIGILIIFVKTNLVQIGAPHQNPTVPVTQSQNITSATSIPNSMVLFNGTHTLNFNSTYGYYLYENFSIPAYGTVDFSIKPNNSPINLVIFSYCDLHLLSILSSENLSLGPVLAQAYTDGGPLVGNVTLYPGFDCLYISTGTQNVTGNVVWHSFPYEHEPIS